MNKYLAKRNLGYGNQVYIMEFPRSGGTWLGDMVSDYLQYPFPKNNLFPIACDSVLHGHWKYDPRYKNVIYMVRDGRDVSVSAFYKTIKEFEQGPPSLKKYYIKHYPFLKDYQGGEDLLDLFPLFLKAWIKKPDSTKLNWGEHVRAWYGKEHVISTHYEKLLADGVGELGRVLELLEGKAPDTWRLKTAVEKFSFFRMTGRKPGQIDPNSNKRKGIPGDWRNHYTPECSALFHQAFGDVLIDVGYEKNDAWV